MESKKLYRLIFIIVLFNVCTYSNSSYLVQKKKVDNIIKSKDELRKYDGYLYIPKFEYKGLIKKGNSNEILDSNNILLVENGSKISDEYGNIVLAGHNNKYVFSILYKLIIDDEVIIYDGKTKYVFTIYERKIINIKEISVLDNVYDSKIITLITCTKDNQKRLILRGILKSHNFT